MKNNNCVKTHNQGFGHHWLKAAFEKTKIIAIKQQVYPQMIVAYCNYFLFCSWSDLAFDNLNTLLFILLRDKMIINILRKVAIFHLTSVWRYITMFCLFQNDIIFMPHKNPQKTFWCKRKFSIFFPEKKCRSGVVFLRPPIRALIKLAICMNSKWPIIIFFSSI